MALGTTATSSGQTAPLASPVRGPNAAGRSHTRARILDAAAQLYRRIGHRKTTIADIADVMSMSPANVYRFFPSKHAIESAVAGELLDELIRLACRPARSDGSATERMRAVLQAIERLHRVRCDQDHRLHELVVTAARENWPVMSCYADSLMSTVAQIISEAQACGEFAAGDPVTSARCVLGAMSAHLDPLLATTSAGFGRPGLDQMIDFCIGALRTAPEAGTTGSDPFNPVQSVEAR